MPVSPQDFELYSRVTGRPLPRSPQERMAMAPEVFKFTRNFARGGQESQEPSFLQQVLGGLGNAALLGAGASAIYGLSRATGRNSSGNNIPPNSAGVTSGMGEPKPRTQLTTVLPEGNSGNPVGGQDEILNKLQRQQEMSEAGDRTLDKVEKMMGMGTIPPDVRESLKEEAFGAVDVDNNDFVNEFLSQLASDTENVENTTIPVKDPSYANRIEAKYSIPRISRTEKNARLGAKWADAAWREEDSDAGEGISTMKENAALDQAFENAVALDNAREATYGIPAGREVGNIGSLVTLPEAVIEASPQKSQGLISAIKQEAKDFDHNIPWRRRADQAARADSALGAAGIMAGTVAEKGAKDVGTRARKIVAGVPQSINTVRNIASGIGDTVTREVINASIIPDNKMQPSKWAEAARLAAGFAPLGGSGGVEINNESDLSDNAQFDDPHQQNEQATPAGINRQTSGLAPDPVEGEMQTIGSAVNELAASFGKGLAHLSPEERVDIARKMIEKDLRKEGYKGPINFG